MPADYRISLVNQPGKDAYPIAGFTWLLVYEQQKDPVKGKKLVEFLNWSMKKGQKMAGAAPVRAASRKRREDWWRRPSRASSTDST